MDEFFTQLGQTVFDRWKAVNFSLAKFPSIAVAAFNAQPPAENVDVPNLIRNFLLDDAQPFQTQSGFGEPELVVFDNPRFYIQLLFWLEGTTDIHQHKFSGAFHVLTGSSIHSRFVFEDPQSVTAHLRVGQLRMLDTQLLPTGTTVPIVSGSGQIHSLFHLDTPSISVVIRTHSDPGTGPQFTYLPPHLAVDPFQNDALTTRRKQLLDVLEKTNDPDYPELVAEMLASLDFERGLFTLQNCIGHLRSLGAWDDCLRIFQKKHGRLARYVAPTLDEIVRRDGLVALRRSIGEVEHRFFLALLLNVPTRKDILEMVAQRFPGTALQTIFRWVTELAELSSYSTWILDAEIPESIAEKHDLEGILAAFRHLSTPRPGKSPMPKADLALLREAFQRSSFRALLV